MPSTLRLTEPERTAAALDGALPTDGGLVLFEGVPVPEAVAAADALASRRNLRLHRVSAGDLLADAFDALQGNLREAFDEARAGTVLLLTEVDVLLAARPRRAGDEPAEPPPHERLRAYFLDRVAAYDGVVALCTSGPADDLGALREQAVVVTA